MIAIWSRSTSSATAGRSSPKWGSVLRVKSGTDTTVVVAFYGVSILLAIAMLVDIARRPATDFELSALLMDERGQAIWRRGASRGTWLVIAVVSIVLGVFCCVVPLVTSGVYFFTLRPQLNRARRGSQ